MDYLFRRAGVFLREGREKAVCNTGKTLLIETLVTEIAFNQKQPITKQI